MKKLPINNNKINAKLDCHLYRADMIFLSRMENPAFAKTVSQSTIDQVKTRIEKYEQG